MFMRYLDTIFQNNIQNFSCNVQTMGNFSLSVRRTYSQKINKEKSWYFTIKKFTEPYRFFSCLKTKEAIWLIQKQKLNGYILSDSKSLLRSKSLFLISKLSKRYDAFFWPPLCVKHHKPLHYGCQQKHIDQMKRYMKAKSDDNAFC